MPRNKRIFPFFLDGGIQTVTGTGTTAWNGTASFVEFTGTDDKTITVGSTDEYNRPIAHGTMVVVKRTENQVGDTTLTVNPSDDFSTNDASITLSNGGDHVLLLWKAPAGSNALGEWVELTFYNDVSDFSGNLNVSGILDLTGDFSVNTDKFSVTAASGNTSVAGDMTVDGTTTLDEVIVDEPATFNSFVIDNITIVDKDGDDQTLTVADLEDGLIQHTPGGADESVILPTAALLAASLESVGDSIRVFVHNDDATNDSTVEMGSGGTLVAGSATISAGICAEFLIRMTNVTASSEAYDVYRL